jgi:molecular chaperone DnaK
LGGGTFDVSIIELNSGVLEVRASHGNTQLGGDDFDELLMNHLADEFQDETGVDLRQDRKSLARLMRASEQAKIELSSQPFAHVREEYIAEQDGRPLHMDIELERRDFEGLIGDLLTGTLDSFDQALQDAGLTAKELDKVLFVGGSTRIPRVWEMVANHAGIEPSVEVNPDEAVALGASVQAAIIAGEPLDAILVDVTPHSLGIAVAEWQFGVPVPDRYNAIIRRNTTIPTSRAQVYSALTPDQTAIELKVYQGEEPVASRNTLLGEFLFDKLKPEAAGLEPRITVTFDFDVNGILKVSAVDRGSGRQANMTVKAAHAQLNPAQKQEAQALITSLEPASPNVQALLERARSTLHRTDTELAELSEKVEALEEAIQEGRTDEQAELTEEIVEILYDLEE